MSCTVDHESRPCKRVKIKNCSTETTHMRHQLAAANAEAERHAQLAHAAVQHSVRLHSKIVHMQQKINNLQTQNQALMLLAKHQNATMQ